MEWQRVSGSHKEYQRYIIVGYIKVVMSHWRIPMHLHYNESTLVSCTDRQYVDSL